MSRFYKSRVIYQATGLVALGIAAPASADNLLTNPGFETPPTNQSVDTPSPFPGWSFVFDCQRSQFHNTPPTNLENIWIKTFETPILGSDGVTQNVMNITGGTNYTLNAQAFFESGYSQSGATVQMGLIWKDSGGNPVGTPASLNIDPTSNPPPLQWNSYSVSGLAPVSATQVVVSLGWIGGQVVNGQSQSAFFDNTDLEGLGIPPSGNEWSVDGSGDWNIPGNWTSGSVPNGVGASASLLSAIKADHTVYTDTAIKLGTLTFDNTHTYVLSGAGSLTMQVASGTAQISVNNGIQKLNLPTIIASSTVLNVNAGANLIVANPITINSGQTLTQSGAGSVTYQSIITVMGSAGIAFANTTHAHELDVAASGTASIGGSSTVLTVDALSNAGKVDVKNNSLVVAYGSGANPSSAIQSQLATGYNHGAWNGGGNAIVTSMSTSRIGVGWKDNSTSKSVTVKYAYYGDANLDGSVNTADFTSLAQHFNAASGSAIWANGDFNYDGKVNALDFNAVAANFGAAPLPTAALGSLVPEPLSGTTLLVAGMLSIASRSRRTRSSSLA